MKKDSPALFFESFCVIGDAIWMSARDFNGLFKGSLKDGTIEFIGCFPGEHPLQRRLHYGEAVYNEEKIYFIPLNGSYVHVFNLRTAAFEKYEIEKKQGIGYAKAILFNDALYMISARTTELLQYDLKSNTCKTIYIAENDADYGYTHGIYTFGHDIFMMLSGKNVMRRFDMQEHRTEDYPVGEASQQYQIVAGKEKLLYFMNKKEPEIFTWDILLGREQKRTDVEYGITLNSWQLGNRVLGNALLGEGITLLDIEQLKTSKLHMNGEDIPKETGVFEIQNAFTYAQDLYFVWEKDGAVYSLEQKEKVLQFLLTEDVLQKVRAEVMRHIGKYKRNTFQEVDVFRLLDFLKYLDLCQQTGEYGRVASKKENGEIIFRRMSDYK